MSNGNMLVDRRELEDLKTIKCFECFGSGRIDWNDLNEVMNELMSVSYKRRKRGNPITTFREMLRVARIIKREGCTCSNCNGSGEV